MEVSRKDGGFGQAVVIETQQRSQNAVVRINASFIISFRGTTIRPVKVAFSWRLQFLYISGKFFFLKMLVTYLDCPTIHSTTASLLFKNEELQHFSAINISFFILTLYLHTCCISSNTFINIENRAPPNKTPYFQMLIQLQFCVLSCPTCSKSSLYVLTPPFSYSPPVTHCILISLCTMMSALPSSVLHTAGQFVMYTLALVKISLTLVLQNPMNSLISSIRWLRFTGHYKLFLHSQKLCKRLETTQISIQELT